MKARQDLQQRLVDYYASEAPLRAPDRVLATALATIEHTPPRRLLFSLPWRFQKTSTLARLAMAAVAVLAAALVGLAVLSGRGPTIGVDPSATRLPSPSISPAASASPAGRPAPTSSPLPALTETMTSEMHGISVSYPAGWTVIPASEPWTSEFPSQGSGTADIVYEKEDDSPFIAVASQPLGSRSNDEWIDDFYTQFAVAGGVHESLRCEAEAEPVTIDGVSGLILGRCPGPLAEAGAPWIALASVEARGYLIYMYRIDDVDWLREIVATVRLHPEDAAVAPVPGVVQEFRRPFSYVLPADVGWDVRPVQADASVEFRIPESGDDGLSAVGIIVRAIDGGRVDPCSDSEALPIEAGPQAVIDYLDGMPGVDVVDQSSTSVDGWPAIQGLVERAAPTADCPELRPFAAQPGVEEFEVVSSSAAAVRVTAFEVGGQHVVIWTFLTVEDTSWYDVADELIASLDFDQPAD